MPIFQDPPKPAHVPTPTPVPGRIRLAFRMHASDDDTRVRVSYQIMDKDLRFHEVGKSPSRKVRRKHIVGRSAHTILLEVPLEWAGVPSDRNIAIDGTAVEEGTANTLVPTWELTVTPDDGGGGAALFQALTSGAGGET